MPLGLDLVRVRLGLGLGVWRQGGLDSKNYK